MQQSNNAFLNFKVAGPLYTEYCLAGIETMKQAQEIKHDHEDDYEDVDYTEPCKGPRCKLCKQIIPGNTQEQYTCRSENVIYKIEEGGKVYIGKTTDPMKKRMNAHRHNVRHQTGDGQKFLQHFNTPEKFANATITVIESANPGELRERESHWIKQYNSYENGLNSTT